MKTPDELLRAIADAITNEGPVPKYHREQVRLLKANWPTLARAVDDAVEYVKAQK